MDMSAEAHPFYALAAETGKNAEEALMLHALPVIMRVANRYHATLRSIDTEDLIQEAMIGVHSAIHHFDPTYGAPFLAYATWWIRRSILRGLSQSRFIRLSEYGQQQMNQFQAVKRAIAERGGQWEGISIGALAEEAGISVQYAESLLVLDRGVLSLDSVPPGSQARLRDTVVSRGGGSKQEALDELRGLLKDCILILSEPEEYVITERYGLGHGVQHTLEEIGQRLGLSRSRVLQIEQKALARLLTAARSRRLQHFLDDTTGSG